MHGLVTLFLEVIALAIILLACRTCCSSCRGADCLDDDSWIVNHCGCVVCFDDSCNIYDCNADGSLIHGYVQQEADCSSLAIFLRTSAALLVA